jgi:hypothetical protein
MSSLQVGLLGELAIAADRGGAGHARGLVRRAHEYLRGWAMPFSILFVFDTRIYVSSR